MADTYNIEIDQGADYFLNLTYKDDAGNPINLTGFTAAMQIRQFYGSATAALTLTSGSGITITPLTGAIAIHATATQTSAITAGNYVYDLEIKASNNYVTRLIQGKVSVSAEATLV